MIFPSLFFQRGHSFLSSILIALVVAVLVLLVLWGRDSEESKLAQIAAQQERYEQTLREELAAERRKKRDGFEEEDITAKDVETAIREGAGAVLSFEPPVDLIEPEEVSKQELSEADDLKAEADKLVEQMEALIAENGLLTDEPAESISVEEFDRVKMDFVGVKKELQELQELSESVDE